MKAPIWIFLATIAVTGCNEMYFDALEKLGFDKREVLIDRIEKARDGQEEAKEEFESALDRFRALVRFEGGDLEETYERLRHELDRVESQTDAVHKQIEAIEDVAGALFDEWESELDDYSNTTMRRNSARRLAATKKRYKTLITAMHRAETKMEPALDPFQDQVLYLKHNLNARAVAALDDELKTIEADIDSLIRDMERSIAEANSFIAEMEPAKDEPRREG
jgi:hypothetical protein